MNSHTDLIDAEDLILDTAVHTMHSDLMGVVIEKCKALSKPWQALSRDEQQDYIDSIDAQVQSIVNRCVLTIAADGRPTVLAKVASVNFKGPAEVKLVIDKDLDGKMPSGAHDLADSTGEHVMIMLPNLEDFEGSEDDKPQASDDQHDLLDSASDDLYDDAVEFTEGRKDVSISALQRHLKVGFNRAARLIDILERNGIIGELDNGRRPVLG